MNENIILTREEALNLLKSLSRFEGFLYGFKQGDTQVIQSELEYPVELLSKKLGGEK